MSLESYNNFFNSVAESAGEAAGAAVGAGPLGAAGVGAGTGAVEGVVENVQDFSWVGDENKNDGGYHFNEVKEEPKMTVDEVYGKGNQSRVESQGDYSASSNEKSNVETNTFGKQDDISVTPVSVTENKGIVNNSTIESVEGLNFQQKDKASQDVLDSRKRRDEVEAEDKSNQMRDKIKATVTNTKEEPSEDVKDFQVGDRNEDLANAQKEVDRLANEKTKLLNEQKKNDNELQGLYVESTEMQQALEQEDADYQAKLKNIEQLDAIGQKIRELSDKYQEIANKKPNPFSKSSPQAGLDELGMEVFRLGEQLGFNHKTERSREDGVAVGSLPANPEEFSQWENSLRQEYFEGLKDFSPESINAYKADVDAQHLQRYDQLSKDADAAAQKAASIEKRQEELEGLIDGVEGKYITAKKAYNNLVNSSFVGEEAPVETTSTETETTPVETSKAETAITSAKDAINNSTNASEEEKAAATESLDAVNNSIKDVQTAASKLTENLDNVSDADIDAYMTSLKELNKNYEDANDKVSFFKRTDFNKQYVTAIAKANDFDVTLADGSKMSFSEFSARMATKSPRIASAMYNAKADRLEEEGHPVLAKMERNKAKMVGNWFGSKFTFADDLVRNQFNQMAETNMRATYAAYNNVLNDPNATPEQKTEARSAIDQANSLMTASAALKASTGFWSGIGDGMGDGTYGTTNPGDLNAYQKTLNKIDNFTKVVLGLGVTPGANRAYENMYYLAGKDVDKSALFNKDFNSDGFALCQEYGNSATAGMIAGAGELSTGVALMFNPSTMGMGANLIGDSVGTFLDGLYGVAGAVNKSEDYIRAVLGFFEDAKDIAEKSINVDAGNEEAVAKITSAINQIENFRLGSEEANSFDNWLEGSGSNTADGGKFNQALTYEEWLKLIEADPTMQEYAKKLIAEKKNAKESNADTGVNS